MALTVTNTNTLQLLNIINRTTMRQSRILTQLATGRKINTGADNPAGLIALENFNKELTAVNAAIDNNQRTNAQMSVAEGALAEVSSLLSEIESLVAASANTGALSASETAANQSQIDSAISSIDRIMRTTTFNGKRLLDGSLAIVTTGVDSSKITNLRVFSRAQATSAVTVTATITASAQVASAAFGTNFNVAGTNVNTSGTTELAITGTLGTAVVTIGSGLTRSGIIAAINLATAQTGVVALFNTSTNNIEYNTSGAGSDDFVSIDVLSGGVLRTIGGGTSQMIETTRTAGVDASVTINGQVANVDGLDVSFTAGGLSFQYSLESAYGLGSVASRSNTETFNVETTGGATFQLGTDSTTRSTLGINSLFAYNLGGGDSGGFLDDLRGGQSADLNTDVGTALNIVKKAIEDVATERGRLGAFQKFQVQTSINSLGANKAGLTSVISLIGDTDFAIATSELNRESVLLNAGIALLGLANQQASQLLTLLG